MRPKKDPIGYGWMVVWRIGDDDVVIPGFASEGSAGLWIIDHGKAWIARQAR